MKFLFNTTIMPNEGVYENVKMPAKQAKQVLASWTDAELEIRSALGHQGSADAFNAFFPPIKAKVNRIPATMEVGDQAMALKVLGRLPEGEVLDLEALNQVGYEFYRITRTA